MKKDDLPEIHQSVSELLELGNTVDVIEVCLRVVEEFPEEHPFWFLLSKALLKADRSPPIDREAALEAVITACKLAPTVLSYMFQYFQVRISLGQTNYIVTHINHRFSGLSERDRADMLGFVKESLNCGLFSKMELSAEVLAELARSG